VAGRRRVLELGCAVSAVRSFDEDVAAGQAWWRDLIETFGMTRCVRRVPTVDEFASFGRDVHAHLASVPAAPPVVPVPPAPRPGVVDLSATVWRDGPDLRVDAARLAARRGLRLVADLELAGRPVRAGLVEIAAGGLRLTPAGRQAATAA
jgi:hypothetical protein